MLLNTFSLLSHVFIQASYRSRNRKNESHFRLRSHQYIMKILEEGAQHKFEPADKIKVHPLIAVSSLSLAALCAFSYHTRTHWHHKLYSQSDPNPKQQTSMQQQLQQHRLKQYQKYQLLTPNNTAISCWRIPAKTGLRNPQRIIVLLHSQHTRTQDNVSYIKNIVESTISDVLCFEYRYSKDDLPKRCERTMKEDGNAVFRKAMEIAEREDLSIVVLGKDLGAQIGIYLCSQEEFRFAYRLKGLIIYNAFTNLSEYVASNSSSRLNKQFLQSFYRMVLKDRWQGLELIKKVRVPIMFEAINTDEYDQLIYLLYVAFEGRKTLYRVPKQKNHHEPWLQWEEDATDYFMEVDIFLNNLP